MNVLAFDTSTEYCSVALMTGDAMDCERCLAGQRHSELLLPMIDAVMKHRNLALSRLSGIAFGAGPGSFTGLRIACGVAQGLAFGASLPVVGIGTLLALAEAAAADRVIACIDARMGEVYHAAYEKNNDEWRTHCEPGLYKAAEVPQLAGGSWVGCGSGFSAHGDALRQRYGDRLVSILADAHPDAAAIARLAVVKFARGEALAAAQAVPLYIRDKVALTVAER